MTSLSGRIVTNMTETKNNLQSNQRLIQNKFHREQSGKSKIERQVL